MDDGCKNDFLRMRRDGDAICNRDRSAPTLLWSCVGTEHKLRHKSFRIKALHQLKHLRVRWIKLRVYGIDELQRRIISHQFRARTLFFVQIVVHQLRQGLGHGGLALARAYARSPI